METCLDSNTSLNNSAHYWPDAVIEMPAVRIELHKVERYFFVNGQELIPYSQAAANVSACTSPHVERQT
jgi:hypothetical protein